MRILNVFFNFLGLSQGVLFFAGVFYFVSNNYWVIDQQMIDFSISAWVAMIVLWGIGLWRYFRKEKSDVLMFAVAATMVTAAFDCCRFILWLGDEDYLLYFKVILGMEVVWLIVSWLAKCYKSSTHAGAALVLSYLASVFIEPQILPLKWLYGGAFVYAILWLVSLKVSGKAKSGIVLMGVLIFIFQALGLILMFYFNIPGIRFYEQKITEPAKDIKVSVVIPVYNAEDKIERCLDSLRRQTLKDIEIIAVDDGSTDRTPEILAKYAKHDARIKVIRQKNAYVGAARNRGLREAKGEYVGFIDNDDWVSPDYYEALYNAITKDQQSVAMAGAVHDSWVGLSIFRPVTDYVTEYTEKDMEDLLNLELNYSGFVWNKLYKTSFLREHNILFSLERTLYEDIYFSIQLMMYLDDMAFAKAGSYFHTIREKNTESQKKLDYRDELFLMLSKLEKIVLNADVSALKKEKILKIMERVKKRNLLNFYNCLGDEDKEKFYEKCVEFFDGELCKESMVNIKDLTSKEKEERFS